MRKPLINPGIIKRLKSFFAIIQDTDTATRYIPAGKYVLYKNIACHASQNIESGDTLALGTNLVTDSDGFINCLNDKLGTKVNTSDIVNALTSTNSTKPLSAAQGKVLNDGLTTLNSNMTPISVPLSNISNGVCTRYGKVAIINLNNAFNSSAIPSTGVTLPFTAANGNYIAPCMYYSGSPSTGNILGFVKVSGSTLTLLNTNQAVISATYVSGQISIIIT